MASLQAMCSIACASPKQLLIIYLLVRRVRRMNPWNFPCLPGIRERRLFPREHSTEPERRSAPTIVRAHPAVSWPAVAAGAVAAAALTLLLVAFGAGMGFSAVSPWSDSGVSGSTFSVATGIYLVLVGIMSSAVGGYIAGRLRSKWTGVHTNEVFFRDTAHGFLAWAFATLICATALASTTAHLANGAGASLAGATGQAARAANPADIYVDKLFRPAAAGAVAATPAKPADNASSANNDSAPPLGGGRGAMGHA